MVSMAPTALSEISKILGKSFVLAAFLPALVFCGANMLILYFLPSTPSIPEYFRQLGVAWLLPSGLAIASLIALLVWLLNLEIIRLYEGYPVRGVKFLSDWQGHQRAKLYEEIENLETQRRTLRQKQPPEELGPRDLSQLVELHNKVETEYPPVESEPLPSKLGNVIRAFEYYPYTRYSIDSIILWPRLLAVIPKEHRDAINTEETLMDFWLNISLLLLVSGVGWAFSSIWIGAWPYVLLGVGCLGISWLAYRAAVLKAISWGGEVKAAFDLYRRDLLRKLDLPAPTTIGEEKRLWREVLWFIMYRREAQREQLRFSGSFGQKPIRAYVLINTLAGKAPDVLAALCAKPGVLTGDLLLGSHDIIVILQAEKFDAFEKLYSEVKTVDGISQTVCFLAINAAGQ